MGPGWEVGGLEEEVSRSLPPLSSRAEAPRGAPEGHLVCRARCPHRLGTALSGAFMCFEINQPGGDAPPPPSLPPQEGSGPPGPRSQASQASPGLWREPGRPLLVVCGHRNATHFGRSHHRPPWRGAPGATSLGCCLELEVQVFLSFFFFLNQISFLTGSVSGGVNTDPYSLYPHQPACF